MAGLVGCVHVPGERGYAGPRLNARRRAGVPHGTLSDGTAELSHVSDITLTCWPHSAPTRPVTCFETNRPRPAPFETLFLGPHTERPGERAAARAHPGLTAPAHSRESRQRLHQCYGENCRRGLSSCLSLSAGAGSGAVG